MDVRLHERQPVDLGKDGDCFDSVVNSDALECCSQRQRNVGFFGIGDLRASLSIRTCGLLRLGFLEDFAHA